MDLEFSPFVRRPFTVEAVKITEANIAEVAEYVGEVRYLDDKNKKKPYIHVNRRLVPNVLRVFPGFWMTRMGDNIRCYANKVFHEQFMELDQEALEHAKALDGSLVDGVEVGAFGRIVVKEDQVVHG